MDFRLRARIEKSPRRETGDGAQEMKTGASVRAEIPEFFFVQCRYIDVDLANIWRFFGKMLVFFFVSFIIAAAAIALIFQE